ncbi:MAG TPA: hypothetical protein VIK97_16375, partial [Casimicrobiaceae bacterium]
CPMRVAAGQDAEHDQQAQTFFHDFPVPILINPACATAVIHFTTIRRHARRCRGIARRYVFIGDSQQCGKLCGSPFN